MIKISFGQDQSVTAIDVSESAVDINRILKRKLFGGQEKVRKQPRPQTPKVTRPRTPRPQTAKMTPRPPPPPKQLAQRPPSPPVEELTQRPPSVEEPTAEEEPVAEERDHPRPSSSPPPESSPPPSEAPADFEDSGTEELEDSTYGMGAHMDASFLEEFDRDIEALGDTHRPIPVETPPNYVPEHIEAARCRALIGSGTKKGTQCVSSVRKHVNYCAIHNKCEGCGQKNKPDWPNCPACDEVM